MVLLKELIIIYSHSRIIFYEENVCADILTKSII